MRTFGLPLALLIGITIFVPGCGSPSDTAAPFTEGRVVLTVTDTAGNPVAGAEVRLSRALAREDVAGDNLSPGSYTLQASETTDAEGRTLFTRVPPGIYALQTSMQGMSHPRIRFEMTGQFLERTTVLRLVKEVSLTAAIGTVPKYQASFNGSIPGPAITVEHDHMVRIILSVPDNDIVHVLRIGELGIKSPSVRPGNSAIIEFVANRPGTFYYYCPLPGHRALGMEGKLVVTKDRSTG